MGKHLAFVIVLCFIICGCPTTLNPYYCDASGHGFRFKNDFGKESECGRNFDGASYRGTGTVTNYNDFDAYIEVERRYYRNTSVVKSFTVEAASSISMPFTGGDTFRIKKMTGEPVGIVRANVLYSQDGKLKVYIGSR